MWSVHGFVCWPRRDVKDTQGSVHQNDVNKIARSPAVLIDQNYVLLAKKDTAHSKVS
jgi:hypothetical protein